jgi:hypothetical protein
MPDGANFILGRKNDTTNETALHRAPAGGPVGSALFVINDNGWGVQGTGGASFPGVAGNSDSGDGVRATSTDGNGLSARSKNGLALFAESEKGIGMLGIGHSQPGVIGQSDSQDGVRATSTDGNGLSARSKNGLALFAESEKGIGMLGIGHSQPGVIGQSDSQDGVRATSTDGNGLSARSKKGIALFAESDQNNSVHAIGHPTAGFFQGDVFVTGDVQLTGGDCAEEFEVAGLYAEPGTVMVIAENETLVPSESAYDTRVAGVVAGGGAYKPGIVLDRHPQSALSRRQISLMGKVFCKVDAQYSPIRVGDMLTTSPTPGHAMAARDPQRAFGAVIGKALCPLPNGQGLIPILIALQ